MQYQKSERNLQKTHANIINLINKMSTINKSQIPQDETSLISELYRSWEQYKIPAIFYHYTLSILSLKPKQQQISYMGREIKLLQMGKHKYQIISDLITARERSLQIITKNIAVLDTAHQQQIQQFYTLNHEYDRDYFVVYQSRARSKYGSRRFIELINHIRIFRKVTVYAVAKIYQWIKQLYENSYQGIIQFLYKNQDYFEKISKDTFQIVTEYAVLFERNPLFIMKKQHLNTQYALVYQYLKIGQEDLSRIRQSLEIVKNHLAFIQRKRQQGILKQSGSRKILRAVNKFEKIYCNFNKNSFIVNNYKTNYKGKQMKTSNFILNPENYKQISKCTLHFRKSVVKNHNKPSYIQRNKSSASIRSKATPQIIQKVNKHVKQQKQYDLHFQFQTGVQQDSILGYLQTNIYKQKNVQQLQQIVRNLIKLKDCISFINIKSDDLPIAWMAVVFNPKDQLFRKVADIIYLQLFLKVPNLNTEIINLFVNKGYGLIKQRGNVIYEQRHIKPKVHSLILIQWVILEKDKKEVKQLISEYECLKNSRILKYYTYSQHTKYHKYCFHKSTSCSLTFDFQFINKITIQGKVYFKVRAQKIEKIGQIWKMTNNLNNYHAILAENMEQVLSYQNSKGSIQQTQGYFIKQSVEKQFFCFPQIKNIKKYLNNQDKQIMVQKFQVSTLMFEQLSISQQQKYMKNYFILQRQSLLAFVCSNQEEFGKTLAIVQFK